MATELSRQPLNHSGNCESVVRNRSLEFLSLGLVLIDMEAPKGWGRQGLSKHILGHRF